VDRPKPELTEKINQSSVSKIVMLPDGSKVVLEKNSKITYLTAFNNLSKRKLYLSGTALFEVHKNPAKPFLVFTNGLITEVLGTKFIIHSIDSGKKVSVEVISGIVSVYSFIDKGSNEETGHKKLNSLILTVNQKASYSGEDKTLMASIVSNPVVVSTQPINFRYENTSIDSVFKSIEQAYGINIIYDEKSLAKRTFTATLATETMFEKMDIICKALNARYEIIDGKIAVNPNVVNQ
ncbi:MAG: FecR family protein, partial [Segetibacter sp.]